MSSSLRVDLGARSYDIVIGADVLAQAGRCRLRRCCKRKQVIIVTDANVAKLYLAKLEASLDAAGISA